MRGKSLDDKLSILWGKAFPLSTIALWLLNDLVGTASCFSICVAEDTLLLDYKPGRRQNDPGICQGLWSLILQRLRMSTVTISMITYLIPSPEP
jgi:hypothetical protein